MRAGKEASETKARQSMSRAAGIYSGGPDPRHPHPTPPSKLGVQRAKNWSQEEGCGHGHGCSVSGERREDKARAGTGAAKRRERGSS